MRLLVLSTRFPEPGYKGDQMRVYHFIRHLSRDHAVTVLTGGEPSEPAAEDQLRSLAVVERVSVSKLARAAGALGAVASTRPAQQGWMTPGPVRRRARRLAASADAVLAVTVRAVPGALPAPLVVDHVDALSLNMRRRAHGDEAWPVRLAARVESRSLRRWERRVGKWAAGQVVTAAEDAEQLPHGPPPVVLPTGWDGEAFAEPAGHVRDLDVVLSGNMAYPPNREAAHWLADEIVPLLRESRPGVRVCVVGRRASTLDLDAGIEVVSDVPDLGAYLRRARIAIVPLRSGTGSPSKVIEAAASGAALVTTGWVAGRYGVPARTAETAPQFAQAALELLADDAVRRAAVEAALPAVRAHRFESLAAELDALLRASARRQ